MSSAIKGAATALVAVWIVTTMTFYAARFSMALYQTHRDEMNAVGARIAAFLGIGG